MIDIKPDITSRIGQNGKNMTGIAIYNAKNQNWIRYRDKKIRKY